jgi:hypothetical protein
VSASAAAPSPRRALRLQRSGEVAAADGGRAAAWLSAALLPLAGSSRLGSPASLKAAAVELAERCRCPASPLQRLLPDGGAAGVALSPTMAAALAYRSHAALHSHSSGGISGDGGGRAHALASSALPWRGAVSATCSADIEHDAAAPADILVLVHED